MLWKIVLAAWALFQAPALPPLRPANLDLSLYPTEVLEEWDSSAMLAESRKPKPWEPQTPKARAAALKALHNPLGDIRTKAMSSTMRNSMSDETHRWNGYPGSGKIPYVIDSSVDRQYLDVIQRAMEQYNKLTCVKFVPRTHERDYLRIQSNTSDFGCWSYMGRVGSENVIQLHPDCMYIGTIVHELGHTIGFWHEHQRYDRDDFIKVYPRNIQNGLASQFRKVRNASQIVYNDFDYSSIMIYGEYAFSVRDLQDKTMEAKNGFQLTEPFEKPGLDNSDIERVNCMYKCRKCAEIRP